MAASLFLVFNHRCTPAQEADARASLGVSELVGLPAPLQELWSRIPPDLEELSPYLQPLRNWLGKHATKGDFVLVQGDFGACWLMVGFALERGLIPVYSTTTRQAAEEHLPDGTVRLIHHFEHHMFRRYGV
jgi:hypothetical protein